MKITTVAYLHGFGGAEKQIIMLTNALAEMGHDVTILVLAEYKQCYSISEKVKVWDLTSVESRSGKAIINRFRAFKAALVKLKPEVSIHYNFQSAYFSVAIPSKYTGKVIYSERGDPYDSEYTGLLGLMRKLTIGQIDGFVFQSEGARDFFGELVRRRSTIIHNPIFIKKGQYSLPLIRDKVIINVGRLHPQKNQKLLVDAFAKVHSKYPDYKLLIYGDGELEKDLNAQIATLKLNDYVELRSSQKDICDIIRLASLFVLSSDYEGMPNVLLEALALGVPCISTDCRPGGARALIKDGFNGFITPVGNIDALAERINNVLGDDTMGKSFSYNSVNIIDNHTPEAIFGKWEEFIKEVSR